MRQRRHFLDTCQSDIQMQSTCRDSAVMEVYGMGRGTMGSLFLNFFHKGHVSFTPGKYIL